MENCKLIATLPNLNNKDAIAQILENPNVDEARLNTGVNQLMTVEEIVNLLKVLETTYQKKIWIDIKGRQLRITAWANPNYEAIELNHDVDITYPAKIYFRNGSCSNITRTRGNKILIDPLPKEALGKGQSVNIVAKDLQINGYLTEQDKQFLMFANTYEMNHIMASFVETTKDILDILEFHPKANIVSKIESLKGLKLIAENIKLHLMAARDDLYIETGMNFQMMEHLKKIIEKDKNAICASRIFTSLEKKDTIDFADYSDINYMYTLGYRNFMLCDNICNHHFEKAIGAWNEFKRGKSR